MNENKNACLWVWKMMMLTGILLGLAACVGEPDPYGDRTMGNSQHKGPPRAGGQAP